MWVCRSAESFIYLINYSVSGLQLQVGQSDDSHINAQSCLTLCEPMDCSPSGSSVCGILQARILEWVAISFSRRSSWPRDQTCISCTAGRFFTWEAPVPYNVVVKSMVWMRLS